MKMLNVFSNSETLRSKILNKLAGSGVFNGW